MIQNDIPQLEVSTHTHQCLFKDTGWVSDTLGQVCQSEIISDRHDTTLMLHTPTPAGWFQPVSSASSQRTASPVPTTDTQPALPLPIHQPPSIYSTSSPALHPSSPAPSPPFHLLLMYVCISRSLHPSTLCISWELQFCVSTNHHPSVWCLYFFPPCLLLLLLNAQPPAIKT